MKIGIIDYGAGNIANVKNAIDKLGANAVVSDSESAWKNSDALVLPGVGAFGAAIKKLGNKKKTLIELIESGKPFLGICLGMQLLLECSEESLGVVGLEIIKGKVKKFQNNLPVPQIGWNKVGRNSSTLFDGIDTFYAYFAHSYYCVPANKSVIAATTRYGISFPSAFTIKSIFATQFHPEKSGENGLRLLQNFIREVKK